MDRPNINFNLHKGDTYDIHDNTGCTMNFGSQKKEKKQDDDFEYCDFEEVKDNDPEPPSQQTGTKADRTNQADIIEQLIECFNRDIGDMREAAATFLHGVQQRSDMEITDWVAQMRAAKTLREDTCNKKLWSILHENGLYQSSLTNWNTRLRNSPY